MSIYTELRYPVDNGRSPTPHIGIFRALPGLGDLLCAVPAWRTLRAAFPQARLSLIGLPETRPLTARFSRYIDEFIPFPGFPGLKEKTPHIPELLDFLTAVQGRFNLVMQMHGSGLLSNPVTMLLGAHRAAGFYLPGQYCPDQHSFLPYPTHLSEVQRYLTLLKFLGIPAQGEALEFPLEAQDYADFAALTAERPLPPYQPYVCLHPGSSHPAKRWPPRYFARVGDVLARWGFTVLLTGTKKENHLTTAVAAAMKQPAINLAGRTPLGALALLLQDAHLLVCNDTGVSHLAAAMQTPSVIVFHHTGDVPRWAPTDRVRHRVIVASHKCENERTIEANCAPEHLPAEEVTAVIREARCLLHQKVLHVA